MKAKLKEGIRKLKTSVYDWFNGIKKLNLPKIFRRKHLVYPIEIPVGDLKKDDLNIQVDNDELIVSGKQNSMIEDSGSQWLIRQYRSFGFNRRIKLPVGIDTSKIEATLKDHTLRIGWPGRSIHGRKINIQ